MKFKSVKVNDAKVGEEDLQLLDEVSASCVLGEQPDSKSEHGPSAVRDLVFGNEPKEGALTNFLKLLLLEVFLHLLCPLSLVL